MATAVVLRRGAQGDSVRQLQAALIRAGFHVATDGIFGPGTEQAVRAAQKANGLAVDGVAGPATMKAITAHATPAHADSGAGGGKELSERGAAFIGHFEGFSAKLYNDPVGHCTIGFGHLVHRGPINGSEPEEFKRGITRERGLEILRSDAKEAAAAVNQHVKPPLAVHQRDALIAFTFNVGTGAFSSSTLLTKLNGGDFGAVPSELNRWTKASGRVLPGLVTRRAAEGKLFANGTYLS